VKLIETFAPVASYFTVNVSSPNTPGLRNLQAAPALDNLLSRVIDARERSRARAGDCPVLLKIAPDLSLTELDDVVQIARSRRVAGADLLVAGVQGPWLDRGHQTRSGLDARTHQAQVARRDRRRRRGPDHCRALADLVCRLFCVCRPHCDGRAAMPGTAATANV